jgi:hypothetical protein
MPGDAVGTEGLRREGTETGGSAREERQKLQSRGTFHILERWLGSAISPLPAVLLSIPAFKGSLGRIPLSAAHFP